jgi:hypothetical protein
MLAVRNAISQKDALARAEFSTIRARLLKIGARVIEHIARIRIQLPTSCPEGRSSAPSRFTSRYPADERRGFVPPMRRQTRQINPNTLHCELRQKQSGRTPHGRAKGRRGA